MIIKVNYTVSDVYMSTSISPVYIKVVYSGTSGGGGGTWGTITGTLSDQTDLQDALDAKVPYTGATGNVNLGEYAMTVGQLNLDISPTGTAAVTTTRWNDTAGLSETTLKGGNVVLKNGVDLVARIVNKVSPNTTLTKAAYQAVRVSGAQGQRLAVALAQANSDANSADTIGLVCETIATNQEGFIITVGQLENINTTGSLQGETWVDGDVLYLSPTTAGAITNIKPTGAGHIVVIGYVEYSHANNGKIYVKVMNGWELEELHDVDIVNPANNEGLFYESSKSLWKNKTIAAVLGYTPVTSARTIGTTSPLVGGGNLSADRTLSIPAATTSVNGYLTSTDWNTFNGKQAALTLTTTGTSGAATLVGSTLNIPQYSGTNIYNSDGTLTAARTLTSGGFPLTFTGSNTAVTAIARGLNLTHTLVAAANNDVLVGLDINNTFTNGSFTGVSNYALRINNGAFYFNSNGFVSKFLGYGQDQMVWTSNGNGLFTFGYSTTGYSQTAKIGINNSANTYNAISINTPSAQLGNGSRIVWLNAGAYSGYIYHSDSVLYDMGLKNQGGSYIHMFANGNVLLTSGTLVDATYKLDVNGTARVSGNTLISGVLQETITTNRQTASYSLVLADRGKLIEMNVASANTLTVPLNSSIAFPIGSKIDVTQYGAGATTITATSGVTIRSFTSYLKLAGQYAACTLVKIGTDEWYCYGNLIA